jgi:NAD(P)-dependent dehydrogenase (short-subunit alcohol dehydrogenase family)
VVTGASGGVGRATARELASRGFDVALLARGGAGLEAAAAEVRDRGGRALCCPVDVADHAAVDAAAARIEAELGAIDVWINDAMTTVFSPAADIEPDDFRRAVEVTFLGQVWGTQAALARMRPRDRGAIVNVGSALAFIGIPLQAPYCASKFACRGYFQSVRAELRHDRSRVRLSMVHLPAVNTPQFDWCKNTTGRRAMPVPPVYEPEVAARAIVEVALDGRMRRIVGSWNTLLVYLANRVPTLGNEYAAIGAWETQLSSEPTDPDAPANLWAPVDHSRAHGARGRFSGRAGGFTDPAYLRTLPATVRTFARAVAATLDEKSARFRGGRSSIGHDPARINSHVAG